MRVSNAFFRLVIKTRSIITYYDAYNKNNVLLVDGSGAGSGDLEILVEGGRVTSSVRSLGGQRFKAAFTPHQALPHRVDIRFNGETVPGKLHAVFMFNLILSR